MSNTQDQRINRLRDDASSMQVGSENDGPIAGFVSVADRDLYIIAKHAIYKLFLADNIDPERKNPSIPNGYQRIVGQGYDSEIVARSFLTANTLFNCKQFGGKADGKQSIDLSIAVMKELLAAQKIEFELISELEAALAGFQQPKNRSVAIPSIEGLSERLKTFIQKIEHATKNIFKFTQLFFGHTEKMWAGFELEIRKVYGDDDEFSIFVASITPFMVSIRNLRHCVEHPKDSQRMIVNDFFYFL